MELLGITVHLNNPVMPLILLLLAVNSSAITTQRKQQHINHTSLNHNERSNTATIFKGHTDNINQNHRPLVELDTRTLIGSTVKELLEMANTGGQPEFKDKGGGRGGGGGNGGVADTDDEDKKTLSQQVADGKYGLIQNELFTDEVKRPGIISYDINPEVPKDNINNLGGLEPEEIWLAENHLLVLAGGKYGSEGASSQWRPIDNYIAPQRQVKIPANPKVPPPFPVQLKENGPIEYIQGANSSFAPPPFLMPLFNTFYPPSPQSGNKNSYIPPPPPYGGFPNAPINPPYNSSVPMVPIIRPLYPTTNFSLPPPLPPYLAKPPMPGAEFLPPFGNVSDIDEDDPSLYYPPPYDFYYPKDNTSKVPAGPLVPGIILPPPPDFFSSWDNDVNNKKGNSKNLGYTKQKTKPGYPRKGGKQMQDTSEKYPNYRGYVPFIDTIYNNAYPPLPTTINPLEHTLRYNDVSNEVTPYPEEKDNKISGMEHNEGWIPIPGPKPYYVTGPKKQINDALVVMEEPTTSSKDSAKQGYIYQIPKKHYDLAFNNFNEDASRPPLPQNTPLYKEKPRGSTKYYTSPNQNTREFYSTTPSPTYESDDIEDTYVKSKLPTTPAGALTSTVTSANMFHPPIRSGGKAIEATYYFYEEPKLAPNPYIYNSGPIESTTPKVIGFTNNGKFNQYDENVTFKPIVTSTFENVVFNNHRTPSSIVSTTPTSSPISQFESHTSIPNYVNIKIQHSKQSKRPPVTPFIPIYYLAELGNLQERPTTTDTPFRPMYNTPTTQPFYPVTTPRPTLSANKPSFVKPTPRPIFEYSYTAPGYDGHSNIHVPEVHNEPYYHHFNDPSQYQQQAYPTFNYYNPFNHHQQLYQLPNYNQPINVYPPPAAPPVRNHKPTILSAFNNEAGSFFDQTKSKYSPIQLSNYPKRPASQYISAPGSWSERDIYNSQPDYQTENPFYAFFTKEDEDLIDDNTKKYFSIFGQKIISPHNGADVTQPTSIDSDSSSTHPAPIRVKYETERPKHSLYTKFSGNDIPFQQEFSSTTERLKNQPIHSKGTYPSSTVRYRGSSRYPTTTYRTPSSSPPNSYYEEESRDSSTISLHGDTLVNYINPPSTTNPDAEYVTHAPSRSRHRSTPATRRSQNEGLVSSTTSQSALEIEDGNDNIEGVSSTVSLEGDIAVNYLNSSRVTLNPDAELIDVSHQNGKKGASAEERSEEEMEKDREEVEEENHKAPIIQGNNLVNNNNYYNYNYANTDDASTTEKVFESSPSVYTNHVTEGDSSEERHSQDGEGPKGEKVKSIHGDTEVNFKYPRPNINPDAELINVDHRSKLSSGPLTAYSRFPVGNHHEAALIATAEASNTYESAFRRVTPSSPTQHRKSIKPPSLKDDTSVNYKGSRPPINPDAEYINAGVNHEGEEDREVEDSRRVVSYQFPNVQGGGDGGGGHFFFLTPQKVDPHHAVTNYHQVDNAPSFQLDAENRGGYFKRTLTSTIPPIVVQSYDSNENRNSSVKS